VGVAVLVLGAFAGGWFGGRAGLVEPVVDDAKGPTYSYGGANADIPAFGLYENQCAPAPLEKGRSFTDGADCAGAHDFEVLYAPDTLGSDQETPYPGLPALRSLAEASCALVFDLDGVIKTATLRDQLIHSSLVPSKESWTSSDKMDRKLYCLVSRKDHKQLSESVQPSK
jgi:hypothetical protein